MKKTTSEWSVLVFLCAAVLLLALASPSFSTDTASDSDKGKIRHPKDKQKIKAFWNQFDWKDLNAAEQAAWGKLGWNKAAWDEEINIPASEKKKWKELNDEERTAATQLGYDEKSWDATPCETKKK